MRGIRPGLVLAALLLMLSFCTPAQAQSTSYGYSGALQTYTVPVGAIGVQVTAAGAGGGGGGSDAAIAGNGDGGGYGGNGGNGALVTGVYLAPAGTVLNIYVGGGGGGGFTSNFGHTYTNSGAVAGTSGGAAGFAGGAGGNAGGLGYSGGGGGGGGASVVATAANAPLIIAGGGGGGQGGSWGSDPVNGTSGGSIALGTLPGGNGAAGATPGANNDNGGGGGGGGGCPGGAGGVQHVDRSYPALQGPPAAAGASCAAASVASFALSGSPGGLGGAGEPVATGSNNVGATPGGNGSVIVAPIYALTGSVYADSNHNGALDATESGTGVAGLYVKLAAYSAGACQSPALAASAVNAGTGAYAFSGVASGNYCLILSGNSTLPNIAANQPAGWIGTQNPSGIDLLTVVAGEPSAPQNFGLYNGSSLSGTVFADTGAGTGIANNGVQDGSERGVGAVTVQASGNSTASAITSGSGSYVLWIPASAAGPVALTAAAPSGDLATGGSAGTTGGSYARPSVTFTMAAGHAWTGVNFGLVPANTLAPGGALTAQPETSVVYAHSFTAGSAGSVALSMTPTATPAGPAWAQVLYQDLACSGAIAANDPVIAAPIAVTAGQKICLLVKVSVPGNATAGAEQSLVLTAGFTYSGANPALSSSASVTDVTTVVSAGAPTLTKLVTDLTLGGVASTVDAANPGDLLQYSLSVTNNGTQPVANLGIVDATPVYTTFVSAACPATLPTGVIACNVTTQPAAGSAGTVQWTITGSLGAGATLTVTYQVKIGS